ncbi:MULTISPECIES: right-handed parallel beta-helix repeat-containing protein [unclassified Flavobacterium]|uniref:right-handed parallel beta-helix repeat-containing protein n=1 Tax=unclassified Flavobacterium TaxID=196869 RepID=UPI0025C36AA9|nr:MULTISPECIES: right-handed parallel beta-helix repeat-containing protein [unclassified Flavobacterium]
MGHLINSKKKIAIGVLVISVLCLSFYKINMVDWVYIKIPAKFVSQFSARSKNYFYDTKNVYKIQDGLPKNFVKDGSVDYTAYVQNSLDNHRKVLFPDFPVLINAKGLTISSNSIIVFNKNSKIKLVPNDKGDYEMLRIHDVENVTLYNANVEGDRYKHIGTKWEWGMGISIRGSKNVKLFNSVAKYCWGDGIYLGITEKSSNNVNITITNTLLDDNRRNGMSIITAENLWVNNLVVANSHGTSPMAGVDIEPDANTDVIKNLNFNGITSFNNATHGFLFALNNLAGTISHNEVNIKVSKFNAIYGELGMSFKLGQSNIGANVPKGLITIDKPQFYKLKRSNFLSYEGNELNPIQVKIKTNTVDFEKANVAFKGAKNILVTK